MKEDRVHYCRCGSQSHSLTQEERSQLGTKKMYHCDTPTCDHYLNTSTISSTFPYRHMRRYTHNRFEGSVIYAGAIVSFEPEGLGVESQEEVYIIPCSPYYYSCRESATVAIGDVLTIDSVGEI